MAHGVLQDVEPQAHAEGQRAVLRAHRHYRRARGQGGGGAYGAFNGDSFDLPPLLILTLILILILILTPNTNTNTNTNINTNSLDYPQNRIPSEIKFTGQTLSTFTLTLQF